MALTGVSSNSSLSGMQAAAQRMQAAASNTANRQTEGFDRRGVVQSASPDGGVQARIVTTERGRLVDRAWQAALRTLRSFAGRGDTLTQVLESKGLESLKEKLAELEGEYQEKLGLFKPGFPEMQQLSARIRELKKQVDAGVQTIAESIRLKHQETIVKESDLGAKLAELEKQQAEFNDKSI